MSVLDEPCLVLNRNWQPIMFLPVQTAIVNVMRDMASVLDTQDYLLLTFEEWTELGRDTGRWIKTPSKQIFSEGKATLPGAHQVHRFHDEGGRLARDVIALADEPLPSFAEPLLVPVLRGGARVAPAEPIDVVRARASRSLASLPVELHALEEPGPSWTGFVAPPSPRLSALVEEVRVRVQAEHH